MSSDFRFERFLRGKGFLGASSVRSQPSTGWPRFGLVGVWIVYFLSSLRGQTAKTLICTKSGVSADSRKSAEKCRKVRRTALFAHFLCIFCAKSAVLRTFRHFLALFLESAETPLFVQINVFAVWPLRLDRKYTRFGCGTVRAVPVRLSVPAVPLGEFRFRFRFQEKFSGTQKGPAEKGPRQKTVKNRHKVSKLFSTLFDIFFAQGKKRQKPSRSVKIFFDTFRQFSRGTRFPAPLGGL